MVEVVDISKKELRTYAKRLRKEIKNKEEKDKKIFYNVLKDKKVIQAKNILIYVSMDLEVKTKDLILEFLKNKKNVYVPKVEGNYINFYRLNSLKDLKLGKFNILEPISNILFKENDGVIIVPGLLFSKDNNRLGYGGGYYDKFLENKSLYKIGLAYSDMVVDKLEVFKYDVKMDKVITER